MRATLRGILYALLAVAILAGGSYYWLLHTESGAAWLWSRTVAALPERLAATAVRGDLRSGLTITGIRYADNSAIVTADQLSFAVDPELVGRRLIVKNPVLRDVRIQRVARSHVETEGEPTTVDDVLTSLQLPFTLVIESLLIDRAAVLGEDGVERRVLNALRLDAAWGDDISVRQLEIDTEELNSILVATISLAEPHGVAARGTITLRDRRFAWIPSELVADLEGDLRDLRLRIDGSDPAVQVGGTVSDLATQPDIDVQVTSDSLPLPLQDADLAVQVEDLKLDVSGGFRDYAAALEVRLVSEVMPPLSIRASVSGDLESLDVERLVLSSEQLSASASGAVSWNAGAAASATIEIERLDPAGWLDAWPDGQPIRGQTRLSYRDGRLEVASLTANLERVAAMLSAEGVVDTRTGAVDARVAWQDIVWPLPPAAAEIDSRAATIRVAGTFDSWTVRGDVSLGAKDLPQGRFELTGSGDRESLELRILDSEVLGGRILGQLSFATANGGEWSAKLRTINTQITPFFPAWPGRLSADFTASGAVDPFALRLDIASLSGNVRGLDVSARGSLRYAGKQLRFDRFQLDSGSSGLQLHGDWQDAGGIEFQFDSPSIADFVPGAMGSVVASGRLQSGSPWPTLDLTLTGQRLAWRNWLVEKVELQNEPAATDAPFGLVAEASGIAAADTVLDKISVSLQGAPQAHQLEVSAERNSENALLAVRGGLGSEESTLAATWRGMLEQLRIGGRDNLRITLREPVALELGRGAASIERACLDVDGGGELCIAGQIAENRRLRSAVDMIDVPLDLLRSFSDTSLQFDQLLSGSMELATGPAGRLSGQGRIDVAAGTIGNPLDERLSLSTRAGFVAFELQEGQLLAGEISLPFSRAAEISGTFRVLDVSAAQDSPVTGQLDVIVMDLAVGTRIFPQIADAGGSLEAAIRIDGTLGVPQLAGGLKISDAHVAYSPLGLQLRNIQLDSNILAGNRVEVTATFDAGNGRGRISSSADYLQGRSGGFEVALAGENLQLVDLPDLKAVINPDLQLGIRGDDIRINGRMTVPRARVSSVAFINAGVSESDDVTFTGPVQPAGDDAEEAASNFNYSGSVVLELGDDVAIDLDLAEARLFGSATYRWQGPALPRATGSFGVSGRFEAYGQLLEITDGTIRYTDEPADNPQLRIRAERDIFGNSQVRRAGVLVSGTALRPKLEVYTHPATAPGRALTLLITGSDFNYDQGVGAVDVGTYIAPRLYASYGIGLFDRENVISVRYDLTKIFGIKATSGKQAAGIDISYTIER